MFEKLLKKILDNTATICVIGVGYTGLPLALLACSKKFKTYGFDIDKKNIETLKKNKSFINYINDYEIKNAKKNNLFHPTTNISSIKSSDIIIICLPTPLGKNREPNLSSINFFMEKAIKYFKKEQLIIFESTTYPGTTKEFIIDKLKKNNFKIGKNIYVGYSPERIDPGRNIKTDEITKIYSGYSKNCKKLIKNFYNKLFINIHEIKNIETCELTKLYENIYRNVNIGLVNEMKIISDVLNINIKDVIDGAETKNYGFKRFNPGPGIGGHCIPIDPFYLTWKLKEYGVHTRFIELSGEINSSMPKWCVDKINNYLIKKKLLISNCKVLIVGLAYKKNVSDLRESPSIEIIKLLQERKAKLYYHDPFIQSFKLKFKKVDRYDINKKSLKIFDLVIIATDHDSINYKKIKKEAKLIFDTRLRLSGKNVISI